MNATDTPIEILLVEDNPGDVELTERALRAGEISNHLTVAAYGADALAHKAGAFFMVSRSRAATSTHWSI